MFDGFSWAGMGVMIGLIGLIVTISSLWLRAGLKASQLASGINLGQKIAEVSEKVTDLAAKTSKLEASTDLRFTELEAHTDNKLGEIRVDLGHINVRLKHLEHQVTPVFGQLVEAGLVNIPAAGSASRSVASVATSPAD